MTELCRGGTRHAVEEQVDPGKISPPLFGVDPRTSLPRLGVGRLLTWLTDHVLSLLFFFFQRKCVLTSYKTQEPSEVLLINNFQEPEPISLI
jgi:hypothetical protein